MSGRKWTAEELDLVRTWYKRRTTKWLAGQVGHSFDAVRQQAVLLGVHKPRVVPAGLLEFIRDCHGRGMLDTEIHSAWLAAHPDSTIDRKSVCNYRHKLGLPVNAARRVEVRRQAYQTQLQVLGIAGLNVLAARRQRRPALEAGLPADLRPLEVRIFVALRSGGYMTRQEIAAAIGVQSDRQRTWFKCRYGSQSALDNLVKRGLVRRTSGRTRKLPDRGKGCTAYEYWVPMDVLQRWGKRSRIA